MAFVGPPLRAGRVEDWTMTEAQTQQAIVEFLRAVLFSTYRVVAIPNGATRTASGRASNAVAGLTPGAPDLMVVGHGRVWFIEVKSRTGKLTSAQHEWGDWCFKIGLVGWCCARNVEDVRDALVHWKIPTRETRA